MMPLFNFLLVFSLFSALYSTAYGDEMVFYKYASGDDYSVYVSSDKTPPENRSAKDTIVQRLMGAKFSISDVSKEFYEIKIIPKVMFFGEHLTQYDIKSISKDRFSHIVWVNKCGKLIKTEVYDLNDRLMFAFGTMDFDVENNSQQSLQLPVNDKKLKPLDDKPFYKGFYHVFTKKMHDGVLHIIFADGINKFSVFINPHPTGNGAVSKIIYGNYLFSQVVSGIEYTVVGSAPYSFMEEVVKVLNSSKDKIFDTAFAGKPITEELFNKNVDSIEELKSEDILK